MCSARPRSAKRAARGFSLLEAVAATAFLAVALMAFAANTIWLTREQKLEQLRSTPLGAPEVAAGILRFDPANPLRADGTAGGNFTRKWQVSGNNDPIFGLRTVTVTVSWTDSRFHKTTLAAYIRCSTIPC